MHTIELCAGAGGQALGLEKAGFEPAVLVEIDKHACATLRHNRPSWNIVEGDMSDTNVFSADNYRNVELLAAGLPCPPFSVAGKKLGALDDRNLFPQALEVISQAKPKAIMLENVKGFLENSFSDFRSDFINDLRKLGYTSDIKLLNASDFGVPQLRPRVVIVALKEKYVEHFEWPKKTKKPLTVGEALSDLMAEKGWEGAEIWARNANKIAPTLVGGSKKHGGPDLGPTRARKAWAELGVNGSTLAEEAPDPGFVGMPRLTVKMAARVQGFTDNWEITGKKTNAYRQVGNAFPPPIAAAVSRQIKLALEGGTA